MRIGESVVGVRAPRTVLTYDDGPTPGVTDTILEELREAGVTATFFVLLSRVRRAPDLLQDVIAAGHEIALHGPDHVNLTTLPPTALPARMRDSKAELEDATGRAVRWFRPPYGAQSAESWQAATDAGLEVVLWSAACRDWLTLSQEEYLVEVAGRRLQGGIVLLHDGFADECDGVRPGPAPTLDRVALTRSVLAEIQRSGSVATALGADTSAADLVHDVRLQDPPVGLRALWRNYAPRITRGGEG